MSELLTERERLELQYLARQPGLLWGGVYARGGDPDLDRWERLGLIEAVAKSYKAGRTVFPGGYRITSAGRALASVAA